MSGWGQTQPYQSLFPAAVLQTATQQNSVVWDGGYVRLKRAQFKPPRRALRANWVNGRNAPGCVSRPNWAN